MGRPVAELRRAALFGLAAGLALSALALGVDAMSRVRAVDCAGLQAAECSFEQSLAGEVARLEGLGALGCALVAAGAFLWMRRRRA